MAATLTCNKCGETFLFKDKVEHFKNCIKCQKHGNERRDNHGINTIDEKANLLSNDPICGCKIMYEENSKIIEDYIFNNENTIIVDKKIKIEKITIFIDYPNLYGQKKGETFNIINNLVLEGHNIRLYMKKLHQKKHINISQYNNPNIKIIMVNGNIAPESLDDKIMIMELMSGQFINTCVLMDDGLDMYRDIGFHCLKCRASKRRYGPNKYIKYTEYCNNIYEHKKCFISDTIIKCNNHVEYKIIL
jgi:hypothetical protein